MAPFEPGTTVDTVPRHTGEEHSYQEGGGGGGGHSPLTGAPPEGPPSRQCAPCPGAVPFLVEHSFRVEAHPHSLAEAPYREGYRFGSNISVFPCYAFNNIT
jgi:hypothetical protein